MSNSVIVNFSNNGQSADYVLENANLESEFGGTLIGSDNISNNISGGALPVGNSLISSGYSDTGEFDEAYFFGVGGWNNVKNVSVTASGTNSILFIAENFVQVDADFSGITDTVELRLDNGKRSNVLTGEGDDRIIISTASNDSGWSNTHRLNTGDGDDIVEITAGDRTGNHKIIRFTNGETTTVEADLGKGDDVYGVDNGMRSTDIVDGGAGSDRIFTGDNDDNITGGTDRGSIVFDVEDDLYRLLADGDILEGGSGADTFNYTGPDGFANLSDGFDFILDFADEDILNLVTEVGDVVTTESATVVSVDGQDTMEGTMVLINGDASVFLQDFSNTSEIFV